MRHLVVKGWKSHALKMTAVALLAPHHYPHGAPLGNVHGFDDLRHVIDEADGSSDVVKHRDSAHLFPRWRHVLEKLEDGVRHILEGPEIHSLII